MKISFVSTSDLGHGAGIAAYNAFNDIIDYSQQHHLNHSLAMWVSEKRSNNPHVVQLDPQKKKMGISLRKPLLKLEKLINLYGPQNYYSLRSKALIDAIQRFETDIVHLHSIHWLTQNFSPRILQQITDRPIIWTIHDMWAFTGHCCYSYDCERWKKGCGNCPDLNSFVPILRDSTAWLFQVKKKIYQAKNLTIISPSVWLRDLAKESPLLKHLDIRCIPYSLDQTQFYRFRTQKQAEFVGKTVILFTCTWLQDPRKGLPFFIDAISKLPPAIRDNIIVLMAGHGTVPEELCKLVKVHYAGDIKDRAAMNAIYNKSDIFVCTTLADNLPNVVLESMATGVPVVSFDTGGVSDMLTDGQTGFCVPQKDTVSLSGKLLKLIQDTELRDKMSQACIDTIRKKFTRDKQAEAYLQLYEEKLNDMPSRVLKQSVAPVTKESSPRQAYPCNKPFTQIYMYPRQVNDFRFCPYHPGNPVQFLQYSASEFYRLFNENKEIQRIRTAFLSGDFNAAGCKQGCLEYAKFKTAGIKYYAEDYIKDGRYEPNTLWLSMGPDCNIRCRYCMEKKPSEIDFNTCDQRFMDMAGEFVLGGGNLLLTGGEPLLPKWKFRETLERLIGQNSCGKIWLQTNGVYLNEGMCDLIMKAPVYDVGISFDTYKEDLFEFLRRGASFKQVYGNLQTLKKKKEATHNEKLKIVILCAVLKPTADHLYETVSFFMDQGFALDLNSLHQSVFAPNFCNENGLHNLTSQELDRLYRSVLRLGEKYGDSKQLNFLGFKGQLENMLKSRQHGHEYQVNLTSSNENWD